MKAKIELMKAISLVISQICFTFIEASMKVKIEGSEILRIAGYVLMVFLC